MTGFWRTLPVTYSRHRERSPSGSFVHVTVSPVTVWPVIPVSSPLQKAPGVTVRPVTAPGLSGTGAGV